MATADVKGRELGAPLFLRTTHRLTLTEPGEAFVPAGPARESARPRRVRRGALAAVGQEAVTLCDGRSTAG